MKALLKQFGLPDIRFHDLRHTFATNALKHGMAERAQLKEEGIAS